jgi:SAM-dependent methyltransferase
VYDDLSSIYDRFIDWPARLERELPRLERWLGDAERVADVACGTGRHALALAARARPVVGFDLSDEALRHARQAADVAGLSVPFVQGAFGSLAATGHGSFDALLCLGNSLPHVTARRALTGTFADFRRLLVPGGRLLVHCRHLALAAERGERWLPLRSHRDDDGTEWLFQRLYDFGPRGRVDFHFAVFHRPPDGGWQREVHSTRLRAWTPDELTSAVRDWDEVALASNLAGAAFDPAASGDIFLTARCPTA